MFVRSLILIFCMALSACNFANKRPDDCGAREMQSFIGDEASDALSYFIQHPEKLQGKTVFSAGHEEVLGQEIPKGSLIIEVNKPRVEKPDDLVDAKVTQIYCHS